MKPQYKHELMTSFLLWFDHELLQEGEAYSNKTGQLYSKPDSRIPDSYSAFQSNYKQWVSDSSVTGTTNPVIPTEFNGNSRSNGFIFDFENGRIIETGGATISTDITGTFAVKDFNVYLTNETEEDLILENKFQINSRYGDLSMSGIDAYDKVVPAIFLNSEYMRNEGFAFGGEDLTKNIIKAVVISDSEYQLDGALSIFADTARKTFSKIPFSDHPSTEYGDIKGGTYNYLSLSNSHSSEIPYFIEDVTVSKFSERAQSRLPGNLKVGFIDFDVSTSRFPRS
tara:strand:+ start:477 stop:1325 length:849 start_codon:yes stop_codon:yes gene_type:complete